MIVEKDVSWLVRLGVDRFRAGRLTSAATPGPRVRRRDAQPELCWRNVHGRAGGSYCTVCRAIWREQGTSRFVRRLQPDGYQSLLSRADVLRPDTLCVSIHSDQDYVYNLANAIRQLSPASEDAYLKELERLVRERDPDHTNRVPNGL